MQQTTGARCVALNQVRPFPPQRPALLAALLLRNDGVIFSVAEMDAHAAEFLVFVQSRLHQFTSDQILKPNVTVVHQLRQQDGGWEGTVVAAHGAPPPARVHSDRVVTTLAAFRKRRGRSGGTEHSGGVTTVAAVVLVFLGGTDEALHVHRGQSEASISVDFVVRGNDGFGDDAHVRIDRVFGPHDMHQFDLHPDGPRGGLIAIVLLLAIPWPRHGGVAAVVVGIEGSHGGGAFVECGSKVDPTTLNPGQRFEATGAQLVTEFVHELLVDHRIGLCRHQEGWDDDAAVVWRDMRKRQGRDKYESPKT